MIMQIYPSFNKSVLRVEVHSQASFSILADESPFFTNREYLYLQIGIHQSRLLCPFTNRNIYQSGSNPLIGWSDTWALKEHFRPKA